VTTWNIFDYNLNIKSGEAMRREKWMVFGRKRRGKNNFKSGRLCYIWL